MKIAYVCQSYPPMVSGAALVVSRLAEGIADRGHRVLVLTASDQGQAYTEEQKTLKTVRMKSISNPMRVDQSFVLWSHGDMSEVLYQFQPDILHTHEPLNLGVPAVRIAENLNVPAVFTIHALPWIVTSTLRIRPQIRHFIEDGLWSYSKWFLAKCDGLIAPSHKTAEIVEAHTGFKPQTISNGVDLDAYAPYPKHPGEAQDLCHKYGLRDDLPVILFVGRIDPEKKIDRVIKAAATAMKEVDAQLLIVGDGNQKEELIQLSQTLGIRQNCRFPGFVSKDGDLPGFYRLASVFLIASEIEVFGCVVLEAAASGTPVVTVQATSMDELVQDGVSGYLVPPGDIKTLAARVVELLKDPDRARAMGKAGREAAKRHANERFLQEHEGFYEEIVRR